MSFPELGDACDAAASRRIIPLVLVVAPGWVAAACLLLYFTFNITYGIVVLGWGVIFGCYYLSRRLGYLSRWRSATNGGGGPDKISIFHFLSRQYLTSCVREAGIRSGERVWYFMTALPYYLIVLTVAAMFVLMVVSVVINLVQ
ncbi:hypothetical protein [Raineyella sp.]|uniref:hypothetical protein n=1 Tax=Raineyella sp. TaxID=1911550 RepID=UPI002B20C032|nr:hypothetical protein [Raineyella sp.]MEA5155119.1 hypothetical protein [Raineyella sp.]